MMFELICGGNVILAFPRIKNKEIFLIPGLDPDICHGIVQPQQIRSKTLNICLRIYIFGLTFVHI